MSNSMYYEFSMMINYQNSCFYSKTNTRNHYLGKCICEQGYMGSRCDRPCQKGFYGFGCRQACPRYTGGKLQCHKGVQNTLL